MQKELLEAKLTGLESYVPWQQAHQDEQAAYNATPWDINPNSREDLRLQTTYLDSQEQQQASRQLLMQEIAGQDDTFAPIIYRLGLLAAFEATEHNPKIKVTNDGWTSRSREWFGIDRSEQPMHPSPNLIERALQIGNELDRLQCILDSNKPVPVVMIWNHHFIPPRLDYDEVVLGEVTKPHESFTIEAPHLVEVEGIRSIDFTIPTNLQNVKKGEIIWKDEYMQDEKKYKSPAITTLRKLVLSKTYGSHNPDALYIGKAEVEARVRKAERDKADYRHTLQRRSRSRLRRRY